MNRIKESYDCGNCIDCGVEIPNDVCEGDVCSTCGQTFRYRQKDVFKLVNEFDGNHEITLTSDNIADAGIEGLRLLGWNLCKDTSKSD